MANYNRVIMVGNLTRDPEYKQLASGQSLCKLGLASNRQFRNRQTDSMVQEVCFVDIDVWGPQADSCNQYLQKGRAVLIEGRLKFDTWQDNNGQTRSKHTIVADRVLFLSAQNTEMGDSVGTQRTSTPQSDENVKLEKELLDQIEEIKSRSEGKTTNKAGVSDEVKSSSAKATEDTARKVSDEVKPAKKASAKKAEKPEDTTPAGGAEFKDQPPFEDDLPF